MNRELMRRVDRLEDHPSFGLRRPPIILWRKTGEDQASIEARAKASGYSAGDRLFIVSWQGARQPIISKREGLRSNADRLRLHRPSACTEHKEASANDRKAN